MRIKAIAFGNKPLNTKMNNGFLPNTSKNLVNQFLTPCTSIYQIIPPIVIIPNPVVYNTYELVQIFLLIGKPKDQIQPSTIKINPVTKRPDNNLKCGSEEVGTLVHNQSTCPCFLIKTPAK